MRYFIELVLTIFTTLFLGLYLSSRDDSSLPGNQPRSFKPIKNEPPFLFEKSVSFEETVDYTYQPDSAGKKLTPTAFILDHDEAMSGFFLSLEFPTGGGWFWRWESPTPEQLSASQFRAQLQNIGDLSGVVPKFSRLSPDGDHESLSPSDLRLAKYTNRGAPGPEGLK